eukprot:TRINITY_DN10177_c0_g1_i1.p1 TRINITY_DN10177_c0_g1~~TRINITY_DN10177_c0_g1_i1.p1  ORF type:complete len:501 (+),score=113.16 TRINITY_DN10177_c0_g1_i1:40-1542(+)
MRTMSQPQHSDHAPEGAVRQRKSYTISKQRENWTDDEHNKFLEALKLYERDWKKIEAHIGTKTVVQIRSHAQKFFLKVQKTNSGEVIPPARPKRKSTTPYPVKAKNQKTEEAHSQKASAEEWPPHYHTSTTNSPHMKPQLATPMPDASKFNSPTSSFGYHPRGPLSDLTKMPSIPPISPIFSPSQGMMYPIPNDPHNMPYTQNPYGSQWMYGSNLYQPPPNMSMEMMYAYQSSMNMGDRYPNQSHLPSLYKNTLETLQAANKSQQSPQSNLSTSSPSSGSSSQTPNFPKIYSFLGSLFDPSTSNHMEALESMSPQDKETVQLLMQNLANNLSNKSLRDQHADLLSVYNQHHPQQPSPSRGGYESGETSQSGEEEESEESSTKDQLRSIKNEHGAYHNSPKSPKRTPDSSAPRLHPDLSSDQFRHLSSYPQFSSPSSSSSSPYRSSPIFHRDPQPQFPTIRTGLELPPLVVPGGPHPADANMIYGGSHGQMQSPFSKSQPS